MLKIRPHHLLCTLSFAGAGYDEEFVKNMKDVISNLDGDIELVKGVDSICICCPLKINDKCNTDDKVAVMDNKVLKYFNLNYQVYDYNTLKELVVNNFENEMFNDICSECEWYEVGDCYNKIRAVE